MGLSASQAKLLSLTARLSDNELRSQTITSAKMALANKTTEASRDYINALSETELTYATYDINGNKTYVALTGTQLSSYASLKNQYCLVNNCGQILVSETDAANYNASADVNEFLACYGVERVETGTRTVSNPDYEAAYDKWLEFWNMWKAEEPDPHDEKYQVDDPSNALYEAFKTASETCYNNAMNGSSGCYLHVLAHMLDLTLNGNGDADRSAYPKSFTTSTGGTISIDSSKIDGSAIYSHGMSSSMVEVSDAVSNGYNGETVYAAEHDDDTLPDTKAEAEAAGITEAELLASNYCYDEDGNKTLKTLQQKCIDLYYIVENYATLGLSYNDDLLPLLESFEEDMELLFYKFDKEQYNQDLADWYAWEPVLQCPATKEETVYTYSDAEKAQWYVNLWHRMNGPSDEKDGTITTTTRDTSEEEIDEVNGEYAVTLTETTSQRWAVLEDGLMNSAEWLKYALESGFVTLEQVKVVENTETSETGLSEVEWTSIIYTNALDISEDTSEKAITLAEAEYEEKTRQIEAKDKQYDNILKLLDTEHTALQTEYDSVKEVISKSIDRNLKIYS